MAFPLASLLDAAMQVINKVIPDPAAKAEAQRKLIELQQTGQLEELRVQMSAILAEAQSADPWTSRARPSFMYVMYVMLLASIPMGILTAYDPSISLAIAEGTKAWLAAIPDSLYALFGAGYLGYTGFRSWDKRNGVVK